MVRLSRNPARIRILPVTSDIYRYYTIADFLLSASDLESVPRSFMEAMAFDLPIVAAEAFGVQDLLQDFRSGWLTRPRDLEGLVGLLHSVLRKPPAEIAAVTRGAITRGNKGRNYGEFYAYVLDALREYPDTDLDSLLTWWTEQKGATP